jgi:hypothetical protein
LVLLEELRTGLGSKVSGDEPRSTTGRHLQSVPADRPGKAVAMLHHLMFNGADQHAEAAGFILRGIRGLFVLVGGVIAAVICAAVAKSKGYSALLFGLLGFFFSILTLIVVLVIPRKDR